MSLSEKQKKFCREYVKTLNATASAIKAGYSPKTASEAKTPVSAEVLKARYESRKLLCKTCDNQICTNACAK